MKNSDWLTLPLYIWDWLPDSVINEAKSFSRDGDDFNKIYALAEDIARKQNIMPGITINQAFPYDKLEGLDFIRESPEYKNMCELHFFEDHVMTINMKYNKCLNKIHNFLLNEPKYRISEPVQNIIVAHPAPNEDFDD